MGGSGPVEHVAISRDPRAHFWSKVSRLIARPGDWRRSAARVKNTAQVARLSSRLADAGIENGKRVRVHHVEHHRAHLASAFFASPFDEAAVVSIDGFGDFSSVMWGIGRAAIASTCVGCVRFPHSLGHFYTAFTQLLGFPKYGDEYKMMGLSAYGRPRFASQVRDVVARGRRPGAAEPRLLHPPQHGRGDDVGRRRAALGPIYSRKMVEVFGPPREPRAEICSIGMPISPHRCSWCSRSAISHCSTRCIGGPA